MNNYAIATNELSRDFPAVRAVDRMNIEVPRGIVFGFLGPNGSGKTTTIRLLLGLLEPSEGRAEVLGFDTATQADEIRQRCGALLEHNGLYERLSAEDNLEFFGRIWHLPVSELAARKRSLLEQVDLWERRKEPVASWSRGMRQKLAVARALLHNPELIFLDEPTAGLDPIAAAALRQDLANLAATEGVTVFLTTHNLSEAEKLCQRVAVIDHGRLLATGSPDELRKRASVPMVEIRGQGLTSLMTQALVEALPEVKQAQLDNGVIKARLTDDASSSRLVQFLVAQGAEIDEVIKSQVDLEQVFLQLVKNDQ